MGQQQLLLLVLGIVIVGLAVVVGIQAFSENQGKANEDAVVKDMVSMATEAYAWYSKPEAMGGGGESWFGISLDVLGYDTGTIGDYQNINARYTLANASIGGYMEIYACKPDGELIGLDFDAYNGELNISNTYVNPGWTCTP
ncbi:MAG: hypothetical protein AAFQ43_01325 [Bacteroidota bacterium]